MLRIGYSGLLQISSTTIFESNFQKIHCILEICARTDVQWDTESSMRPLEERIDDILKEIHTKLLIG